MNADQIDSNNLNNNSGDEHKDSKADGIKT